MTVESATYINTLDANYPASGDQRNEGDNHLRLIKSAVKTTFPNVNGAVNFTPTEANLLVGLTGNIRTSASTPLAGEFVLMKATSVSGSPSAVDFVNGSGGVTLSTAYDEYLVTFTNIRHASSTNAKLRMGFSSNAGGSYDGVAQGVSYSQAGTTESTDDRSSIAYFPVMSEQANASATGNPGVHGWIHILRPVDNPTYIAVRSHYIGYTAASGAAGWASAWVVGGGSGVDALRLYWDSGNFANAGAIKLYGRKA